MGRPMSGTKYGQTHNCEKKLCDVIGLGRITQSVRMVNLVDLDWFNHNGFNLTMLHHMDDPKETNQVKQSFHVTCTATSPDLPICHIINKCQFISYVSKITPFYHISMTCHLPRQHCGISDMPASWMNICHVNTRDMYHIITSRYYATLVPQMIMRHVRPCKLVKTCHGSFWTTNRNTPLMLTDNQWHCATQRWQLVPPQP